MDNSFSERLELLEKRIRRLRGLVLAGGVALAFVGGLAFVALLLPIESGRTRSDRGVPAAERKATVAEEVVARRFLVVDKQGRVSGVFGLDPEGRKPEMALVDENATIQLNFAGVPRPICYYAWQGCAGGIISLVATEPHPGIFVETKKASASLKADPQSGVEVSGETGYSATLTADISGARLFLSDGRRGQKTLEKFIADSKRRQSKPSPNPFDIPTQDLILALFEHGDVSTAGITLDDGRGKPRIQLGTDETGEPSLDLYDDTGSSRAVLGNDALENTRTGSAEKTGPSSLVLFGNNKRVIWRAP